MVCLGNICRSPMAEGILRHKAKEKGLHIEVDSAGFEPYHSGDCADSRAIATAKKYGIDINDIRSRTFKYEDFKKFDKIFVMDNRNYTDVMRVAKSDTDRQKTDFILNITHPGENRMVPDPYYGGNTGFENVFEMLDRACEKFCEKAACL